MFIIREAHPEDLDDLHALAKQTFFINLPPDREIISDKIDQSRASFMHLAGRGVKTKSAAGRGESRARSTGAGGVREISSHGELFLFVLEDTTQRAVIGTSQLIAPMGGPGNPRLFMQLGELTRQSRSLKIKQVHTVGSMGGDESGPTELGGLILNHAFRKHEQRLGRFLSFVRMHFIGLNRRVFSDRLVAEMLGVFSRDGRCPFFEKFTHKFIPRPFDQMYRFSQHSREFVTGLLPAGEIILSILDPEVASTAGEVSDETRPARHLLEKLGFEYHQRIDPLDGGPHLEAQTDRVALIKQTRRIGTLTGASSKKPAGRGAKKSSTHSAGSIVSTLDAEGRFRAVQCDALSLGKSRTVETVQIPEDLLRVLESSESRVITRGLTDVRL